MKYLNIFTILYKNTNSYNQVLMCFKNMIEENILLVTVTDFSMMWEIFCCDVERFIYTTLKKNLIKYFLLYKLFIAQWS